MPALHLIHVYHVEWWQLLVSFHGYKLRLHSSGVNVVDLHELDPTQLRNIALIKLKIFKANLISGKSSI